MKRKMFLNCKIIIYLQENPDNFQENFEKEFYRKINYPTLCNMQLSSQVCLVSEYILSSVWSINIFLFATILSPGVSRL